MATSLHRIKGEQFFDDNGDPLAGGKLYYYEATTTNLQDTFSAATGAPATNSNPLILDASGRLQSSIFFGDSASYSDYKELLTDANDVAISNWPVDNLPAAEPSATASAFAPPLFPWTQVTNVDSPVALTAADAGKAYEADSTSGNIEFDLPSAASVGNGKGFVFKKTSAANSMVIDPNGSETIDNSATSMTITRRHQVVAIYSNGAEWYIAFSYLDPEPASDTVAGLIEIAVDAEMEAGSSLLLAVPPGRQHQHPSAAKAWVRYNNNGTPAINADYGVSSLTDGGAGHIIVNFDTAFSSVNYGMAVLTAFTTGNTQNTVLVTHTNAPPTASGCRLLNVISNGTLEDKDINGATFFGDL